jgi:hypothetical protein
MRQQPQVVRRAHRSPISEPPASSGAMEARRDRGERRHERYGALQEGAHVAGYTFERACSHLEWLLENDRWKLGDRFEDVNAFLNSIRLDQFRQTVEQRKRIAEQIKKLQPAASMRAIGPTLGVSHAQVERDLAGTNVPPSLENTNKNNNRNDAAGTDVPPALSGAEAAKLAHQYETKTTRDEAKRQAAIEKTREIEFAAGRLGKFVVLSPWRYENPPMGGSNRSIENHYPTLSLEEICGPCLTCSPTRARETLWVNHGLSKGKQCRRLPTGSRGWELDSMPSRSPTMASTTFPCSII